VRRRIRSKFVVAHPGRPSVLIVSTLLPRRERTSKSSDIATTQHLATQDGHTEAIQALLVTGASVDVRKEDQWTSLTYRSPEWSYRSNTRLA
jgi:hypothetical protein